MSAYLSFADENLRTGSFLDHIERKITRQSARYFLHTRSILHKNIKNFISLSIQFSINLIILEYYLLNYVKYERLSGYGEIIRLYIADRLARLARMTVHL